MYFRRNFGHIFYPLAKFLCYNFKYMDSSYTNPYGAQPSIPDGGQETNTWPPVSDAAQQAYGQYGDAQPADYQQPAAEGIYGDQTYAAQPQDFSQYGMAAPVTEQYTAPVAPATPTYSGFQDDIILDTSAPVRKLDLKRILILAGAALAVVVLFAVVIIAINNKNEADARFTAQKQVATDAIVELGTDYNQLLENYKVVGYIPATTLSNELENDSRFFLLRRKDVLSIYNDSKTVQYDIEELDATDFSMLSDDVRASLNNAVSTIRTSLETIVMNATTLRAFYDVFVNAIEELDEDNADFICPMRNTDVPDLTIDGAEVDDAIAKHEQAYCSVNDEVYGGTFDGNFDSIPVRDAKEALIGLLLNLNDQKTVIDEYNQVLAMIGADLIVTETESTQNEE